MDKFQGQANAAKGNNRLMIVMGSLLAVGAYMVYRNKEGPVNPISKGA